jgi:hypothetical protein
VDFQIGSDRVKKTGQSADVHIGAALDPGNVSLANAKFLGDFPLRHLPRFSKLMERHLFDQAAVFRIALGFCRG